MRDERMKRRFTGSIIIIMLIFNFIYLFDIGGLTTSPLNERNIHTLREERESESNHVIQDSNTDIQSKVSTIPIGWTYGSKLSINPVVPQNDYQIKLILTPENFDYSQATTDGRDIRIQDLSDNPLNYWIESWNSSGNSIIWIKVPLAGTSEIMMYYGNPSAIDESNGDNTFVFFDDFEGGSIDLTKWTTNIGVYSSASVSGGILTVTTDNPDERNGAAMLGFNDFYFINPGADTFNAYLNNSLNFGEISRGHRIQSKKQYGSTITENALELNSWNTRDIRWISGSLVQYNNGSSIITHTNSSCIPDFPLGVRILTHAMYYGLGYGCSGALNSISTVGQPGRALRTRSLSNCANDGLVPPSILVDWVAVRECVEYEPAVTVIEPITINSPPKDQYSKVSQGHYPASYSFENDPSFPYVAMTRSGLPTLMGQPPNGWVPHYSGQAGTVRVIDDYMGHKKVVELFKRRGSFGKSRTSMAKTFPTSATVGTIEFWFNKASDTGRDATKFILLGTGGSIELGIENQALYRGVYASRVNISEYVFPKDTWKQIRIDFDISQGGWQVHLDGTVYGSGYIFPFEGSPTEITGFDVRSLGSEIPDAQVITGTHAFYFDAFGYSWDPFYTIGDNLNEGLLLDFDPITRSRTDWEGYYPASEGYDEIPAGGQPDNWGYLQGGSAYDENRPAPEMYVLDSKTDGYGNTHKKVLYCQDNTYGTVFTGNGVWDESRSSGTVDFWILVQNNQYLCTWGLFAENSTYHYSVRLGLDDGPVTGRHELSVWDGTTRIPVGIIMSQNKWYRFSIDFSDDGLYAGLAPHTYRVRWYDSDGDSLLYASPDLGFSMDGKSVGFLTSTGDSTEANMHFDAMGHSWDPNYNIGDNRFPAVYEGPELAEPTWIGYSMDSTANVTIEGDTSMVLPSLGTHDIQIYYGDTYGSSYRSEIHPFQIMGNIDIATPENIAYEQPMSGYYPGTYGFEDQPHGTFGTEIDFIDEFWESVPGSADFVDIILWGTEVQNHSNFIMIRDAQNSRWTWAVHQFDNPPASGVIEFYLLTYAAAGTQYFHLRATDDTPAIEMRVTYSAPLIYQQYFDGSSWQDIAIYSDGSWLHNSILFDCEVGINGQFNWTVSHEDGTEVGRVENIEFRNDLNTLDEIYFASTNAGTLSIRYDAFGFSWEGYSVGDNLNEGLLLSYADIALKQGHYPATYSFENENDYDTGLNIEFLDEYHASGSFVGTAVFDGPLYGHRNYYHIGDAQGGHYTSGVHIFDSPPSVGTLEFFVLGNTPHGTTGTHHFILRATDDTPAIQMRVNFIGGGNGIFQYYDGSAWQDIANFIAYNWYHHSISFDCTAGINGQFTYIVSFENGTEIGRVENIEFVNNLSTLDELYLASDVPTYLISTSWDAFGFSWDPNYNIGDNLLETLEPLSSLRYSLDGQVNISIHGNHTIPWPSPGSHTIQVFGSDYLGNIYSSDLRSFSIFSPDPPSISGPNDFTFNYGDSGYSILWSVSDPEPSNYTVYQNGTIFAEGTWTTLVLVSLEGIEQGNHNFTCVISNLYGLKAKDEVWITVLPAAPDTTPPMISSPSDLTFEEGSIGYSLIWIGSDNRAPWWASVIRNSTLIYNQAWIGNDIVISLDGTPPGVYFYNCTLSDEAGNSISDIVKVSIYPAVPDTQEPLITPPNPTTFELNTPGSTITFICVENHPYIYRVSVNGTEILYNPWRGENITVSVENLLVGKWNITLELWDLAGNYASGNADVEIIHPLPDITPPSISQPADIMVLENMGGTITWEVIDDHPQFFVLLRNGTLIYTQDSWESGLIQYSFTSLPLGNWVYTLTVWDQAGNSASSSAVVRVVEGSEYDNLPPEINHLPDITITFGTVGNSLTFYLFDSYPQGYRVYLDSVIIAEESWTTTNIQVKVYLDGLAVGMYYVNLTAWDIYGNWDSRLVKVTVDGDVDPPTISSPPDTIAYKGSDSKLVWEVDDAAPSHFEIRDLSNGSIISEGPWSGEDIEFDIEQLDLGVEYHLQCTVYDMSGNFAKDDVRVTLLKPSSAPGFEFPGIISLLLIPILFKKRGRRCKK